MSKGKEPTVREKDIYVTARGIEVEIVGVSPFEMDDLLKSVPLPAVPTRTIEVELLGFSEVEELNADNLQNDEERAIWARYVREREEATRLRNTLATDYAFLEGTRFPLDDLEVWKEKRRRWNLPVPDDALEAQKLYFRTHVIGGGEDIAAIMTRLRQKSGVDEATLEQVAATF